MQLAIAPRGDARAFLTHFVVSGLDDDRYVIEKFRSLANGPDSDRAPEDIARRPEVDWLGGDSYRSNPDATAAARAPEPPRSQDLDWLVHPPTRAPSAAGAAQASKRPARHDQDFY